MNYNHKQMIILFQVSYQMIFSTIGESTNVATFNDLVPGAEYTVQVRSVVDNNNVESDLSEASFYTSKLLTDIISFSDTYKDMPKTFSRIQDI